METKCRACTAATYSRLLQVRKMKSVLLKNVILFILFGCFYVTIEVFYRGFSHPLMFFVAGISAVIVDKFNNEISWDVPLWLQSIWGTLIILILELSSGYFSLIVLGVRIWDYSQVPLNYFDGLICVPFAFIWYGLTVVMIILADMINYYMLGYNERPYYTFKKNGRRYYLPKK